MITTAFVSLISLAAAQDGAQETSVHWPSFRGAGARGVAEGWATAVDWDLESGENVRWRKELPGMAHSSPVIWGERIFLATAVRAGGPAELKVGLYGDGEPVADDADQSFEVLCLDKESGDVVWRRTAWKGQPRFERHPKASYAASTCATDGQHVLAFFGSEGLYCYDAEGQLAWKRDFGPLGIGPFDYEDLEWGWASSPVIHEDAAIVQCDNRSGSFLAVLELATGEERWRVARDEDPTWCTPTVDVRPGRSQIVCNGYKHIGGYDLESGAELWKIVGGGDVPVPTPVVAHDLIFITNAHGRLAPIYAVKVEAEGELGFDHEGLAWSVRRRGNYMQTPLVYGEELYCCNDSGRLTCYDARSGDVHYAERLGGGGTGFSASGVAADGKLYFTSETGEVHVLAAGPSFETLAVNDLLEECMATPAVSEGVIYWRTRGHLVAVGQE